MEKSFDKYSTRRGYLSELLGTCSMAACVTVVVAGLTFYFNPAGRVDSTVTEPESVQNKDSNTVVDLESLSDIYVQFGLVAAVEYYDVISSNNSDCCEPVEGMFCTTIDCE